MTQPLLDVRGATRHYSSGGLFGLGKPHVVRAVDGVSFTIGRGETLGLVGESGSGKSTTGRLVLGLETADAGSIRFDGEEIVGRSDRWLRKVRRRLQVVFQDPNASLNPRRPVGWSVTEPLAIHQPGASRAQRRERAAELFRTVGLSPDGIDRYPHEFSGGQRQRMGIARAISVEPSLIVADEPITALDVSVQAQIVNLLVDLQAQSGLSYLFITHDLRMVRHLCHRVAVMLYGRIVEIGPTKAVFANPSHPYTRSLLAAAPLADPDAERQRRGTRTAYTGHVPHNGPLLCVGPDHFAMQALPDGGMKS